MNKATYRDKEKKELSARLIWFGLGVLTMVIFLSPAVESRQDLLIQIALYCPDINSIPSDGGLSKVMVGGLVVAIVCMVLGGIVGRGLNRERDY